jgi:hypothetical protein
VVGESYTPTACGLVGGDKIAYEMNLLPFLSSCVTVDTLVHLQGPCLKSYNMRLKNNYFCACKYCTLEMRGKTHIEKKSFYDPFLIFPFLYSLFNINN